MILDDISTGKKRIRPEGIVIFETYIWWEQICKSDPTNFFFLNLDVLVAKAINNIGDTIIDLLFYSLNKLRKVGVNSMTIGPRLLLR